MNYFDHLHSSTVKLKIFITLYLCFHFTKTRKPNFTTSGSTLVSPLPISRISIHPVQLHHVTGRFSRYRLTSCWWMRSSRTTGWIMSPGWWLRIPRTWSTFSVPNTSSWGATVRCRTTTGIWSPLWWVLHPVFAPYLILCNGRESFPSPSREREGVAINRPFRGKIRGLRKSNSKFATQRHASRYHLLQRNLFFSRAVILLPAIAIASMQIRGV